MCVFNQLGALKWKCGLWSWFGSRPGRSPASAARCGVSLAAGPRRPRTTREAPPKYSLVAGGGGAGSKTEHREEIGA